MNLMSVKLRRDLRATWPRLAMMVAAISVSLIVFGGILFGWSAITRETERAYLGTQPASATIRFAPGIDADRMADVAGQARGLPGVLEAAGRTQFTTSIAVSGQERALPLQVFVAAADDPMRLATFQVRQGHWPPAPGEIFLRQDSLALLHVAVGDTIAVTTPAGSTTQLKIAGTVYDPSLAPGAQQQTGQAYLSAAALAALGEPNVFDQLKLQIGDEGSGTPGRDREQIVATASQVASQLQDQHGLAIREIQVPRPYAHPHQGQADALLSALLAGAGAALLLAVILVATMLSGLFRQQIPQIGIMKAIGARSARVGGLYLAMTLIVATAATGIAIGPAIWIGRTLAPLVFGFLGIQPAGTAPAWWTYLVVIAAGIGLPVALTLIPLVKTARTTVRAAIDHHGASSSPAAATRLLTRLGRIPGLDRSLLLALRNMIRRPARFALSVGLLAIAGMTFVAGLSARDSTQAIADEATDRLRWDVTVQLASPASPDDLTTHLRNVPGLARVEGWSTTPAAVSGPGRLPVTRTYPDQGHGGVFVTAVPADTTMLTQPDLREGRWLTAGETGTIVLSQVALKNTGLQAHPDDTVQLWIGGTATTWRVVGITQERSDAGGAYVTAQGLAHALGQPVRANTLRIATTGHDETARTAAADAIDQTLTDAGIDVTSADSVSRQEASTGGHLAPILVILLATALPMGLIGCIGLASTMSANILERTREFGIMHAIGARPKTVRRIVVAEGIFIALTSCLIAALPAIGLAAVLDALLGNLFFAAPLPLRISLPGAAIWTVLITLGAMLATEAAASRAARITVREALTHL